jgi:hypothetical protein
MKAIGALIVFGVVFTLAYLVGAFICWDLNAGNWDPFARVMVGIIGTFASLLGSAEVLA